MHAKYSDAAIRRSERDFMELEEQGKLKRIHGGAFIPAPDDRGVPVDLRARLIVKEKHHIATTAAEFVRSNDIIMLDSSTTCGTLASYLLNSWVMILPILTNSLQIISEFSSRQSSAHLICAVRQI